MGGVFGYANARICLWSIPLPALPAPASRSIQCRAVPDSDAGAMTIPGLSPDRLADRLGRSQCYAGRVGGEIATSGWVSREETWIGEVAATLRPGDGEAYVWDCRTSPGFRGRGFYHGLLAQIVADLGQAGLRRVWIATLDGGTGHRAVARAGFHPVVRIRHFSLGPLQRWWVRPDGDADTGEIEVARRALRLGQRPEPVASTSRRAAPPAPAPR